MRGSIRVVAGLLVTMGAVGTIDADPNASLLMTVALAVLGLALMFSGTRAMNRVM